MISNVTSKWDTAEIREKIQSACAGVAGCEPSELELEVQVHLGAGEADVDSTEILTQLAVEKISIKQPGWTFVAARLLLQNLYQKAALNRGYQLS